MIKKMVFRNWVLFVNIFPPRDRKCFLKGRHLRSSPRAALELGTPLGVADPENSDPWPQFWGLLCIVRVTCVTALPIIIGLLGIHYDLFNSSLIYHIIF